MNFGLLEKMVRIPSPSGKENELALLLKNEMNSRGFKARIGQAGNMIAAKGSGKPLVLLTAHMDTFPKQIPVKRTRERLYGRGAVDTKASLFAFIEAASAANPKKGTIVVAGTVEEECPTNKGAYFLAKSIKPDFCIVGEPSGWDSLTIGYKGILDFNYSLNIAETHFSSGENASLELVEFVNSLKEAFTPENSFGSPSLEIREINSNHAAANARIVLRVPPAFEIEKAKKQLVEISRKASLEFQQELPAVVAQKNTALTRAFLSSIRAQDGIPSFKKKSGTGDMNVFAQYWNCPMLTYGPGNSHLDHSDNEHVEFSEISKAANVLEGVLSALLH